METIILNLKYYLLILVRVSGFFVFFPGFGTNIIPVFIKTLLIFIFWISISFSIKGQYISLLLDNSIYFLLIIKEIFLGFLMGFFVYLPFMAVRIAGELISFKTMFSISNVVAPTSGERTTLWGQFFEIYIILIFFAINGHLLFFKALFYSLEKIPVNMFFMFDIDTFNKLLKVLSNVFLSGVAIAMPVVFIVFVMNLLIGILSKTMPQFNIFYIGLPLNILIVFLIIIFTSKINAEIINNIINNVFYHLHIFLRTI